MQRLVIVVVAVFTAIACRSERAPTLLYVSNEGSGDVTCIDADRGVVVRTIAVGRRPRGLALSPDRKRLYVALSGSPRSPPGTDTASLPPRDPSADGIAEISLETGTRARMLEAGRDPETFALSPDGRSIVVSNEESGLASVIDVESGRVVRTIAVGGEPEGVAFRPDGRVAYVTSEEDGTVTAIDPSSGRVLATVPVGARPRAIAFTGDGRLALVTSELGSAVTVLDAQLHAVRATVPIPGNGVRPMGIALTADGMRAFVATGRGGGVAELELAGRRVMRVIGNVGARPWGIAASRDGRVFTANGPSDDVSVLDAGTGAVVRRVKAGASPWGIVATD